MIKHQVYCPYCFELIPFVYRELFADGLNKKIVECEGCKKKVKIVLKLVSQFSPEKIDCLNEPNGKHIWGKEHPWDLNKNIRICLECGKADYTNRKV